MIVNSGLHDIGGGHPVESYLSTLPIFFDMLLPENRTERDHIIWLSTNPKILAAGTCPDDSQEGNGGVYWMNLLAGMVAKTYPFTVMDGHRIVTAANLAEALRGVGQCGDGHHCLGCNACWAKALVLMHYMASVVARQRSHPLE